MTTTPSGLEIEDTVPGSGATACWSFRPSSATARVVPVA